MAKLLARKKNINNSEWTGYAGVEYGVNTTLAEDIPFATSDQFKLGLAIPITFKGTVAKATNTDLIEGFVDPQQIGEFSTVNEDIPKTGDQVKLDQYTQIEMITEKAVGTLVYLDDDGELNDTAGTNSRQIGIYKLDEGSKYTHNKANGLSRLVYLNPARFDA